ncbi:unnamed protein product [Effrenium voratum]|nr:unnamed protein product [Effrenium voratum]
MVGPKKKSFLPCCGSKAQGEDEDFDAIDPAKQRAALVGSQTSRISDEWSPGMLNVVDPYESQEAQDANNPWTDVEPKMPELTSTSLSASLEPAAPAATPATPFTPAAPAAPAPAAPTPAPVTEESAGRSAVCQAKEGRARLAQARETPGFFTEDFETTTGLNLVRTHLNSCMLQDHELPLADVLQAKVASIRAMSEATAAYQFEHAKQLKHLRDGLNKEQSALWARLARAKQVMQQIAARVAEAVEVEDFDKAEQVYELQKLAEDCIKGFCVDESQGGSVDLSNGCVELGPTSEYGLLGGDFSIEFWMRCQDVTRKSPLLTSSDPSPGTFPSLYVKPGGSLELQFAGGKTYSCKMSLQRKRWTHVAVTWGFDGSDFKVGIFQDGVQVGFGAEIWAINVDSDLRLGPFPGHMAELRIWDHAKTVDQVEVWMPRRCSGEESGLHCCLSFRPARGLSDSTLDPQMSLAAGHVFADRGACKGDVIWDGDCPQLVDAGDVPTEPAATCSVCSLPFVDGSHFCRECGQKRPVKQVLPPLVADPWTDESLKKAFRWLDGQHETEASQRRSLAERRQEEHAQREADEQQRRAYMEQERLRQQEEEEARLQEEKAAMQNLPEELARSRPSPMKMIASWACPFASFD